MKGREGFWRKSQSGVRLHLLLHVVHHGYGCNQDDGGNDLALVKARMEESPVEARVRCSP